MILKEPRKPNAKGFLVLPLEFKEKGFEFKQVFRKKDLAIYHRQKPGSKMEYWEAIKVLRHNGYKLGDAVIPPSETYPSSEQFGILAYACLSEEAARLRLKDLAKR